MVDLGLNLVSETHGPGELVEYAPCAEDAGFDHVYLHQAGMRWRQLEFIEFAGEEILPEFE